ncbi:MAG: TIGR03936 family radical SAM-associated protein, partial [Thermodesulfovibrionales bacterium]
RGDRSMGSVIEAAWREGARLEGWSECFDLSRWERAMEKTGISIESYARGNLNSNAPLPWDVIDSGVSRAFLFREYQNAVGARKTSNCSEQCHACGLQCASREFLVRAERSIVHERPEPFVPRFSPVRVRVRYSKGGDLRFLSHLELMGALERGLRRAGVPLSYSEGYHPAPKLSFGPALGVGIEGEDEYFDMEVHPPFDIEKFTERIGEIFPEGLTLRGMRFIENGLPSLNSFINCHEYSFEFKDAEPVRRFLGSGAAESRYRSMIVKTDIVNERMIKIAVQESEAKKIRVSELLTELFGVEAVAVRIRRTAQWGGGAKMISPLDPGALSVSVSPSQRRAGGKRPRIRMRSKIDVK